MDYKYRWLTNDAHDLLMKAEEEITEYKKINVSANSARMQSLVEQRDHIKDIMDRIEKIDSTIHQRLLSAETDDSVQLLREGMENDFKSVENELKAIKEKMK